MNVYNILSDKRDKIHTEILYTLASYRASGKELAVFSAEGCGAQAEKYVDKCLRTLKQGSKIDFYVKSSEIDVSTEGSYLLNKHPEITDYIRESGHLFIVKL